MVDRHELSRSAMTCYGYVLEHSVHQQDFYQGPGLIVKRAALLRLLLLGLCSWSFILLSKISLHNTPT